MEVTPDLILFIVGGVLCLLEAVDFKLGTTNIKLGWVGLALVAFALSSLTA